MKKLAIIYPIISFVLFCAMASMLGAVAGFFCVLALSDSPREVSINTSPSYLVDFLKNENKRRGKFEVAGFKCEIANILYEDFCAKGVSVGEISQSPDFELKGEVLKISIDVNSPILIFNLARSLSFEFKVMGNALQLIDAHLSNARIPLPIAKIILKNTLKKYRAIDSLNELSKAFFACKMEVENGVLVLEK